MRLLGIFLLFCISIGTVSPLFVGNIQLPSWLTSLFTNPIDKLKTQVCSYLAKYPDRASTAINKIQDALGKTDETRNTFVTTLNYINSAENQQKLIDTNTCPTFFNELQQAMKTDLQNKQSNLSNANALQAALDKLKNFLNDIKTLFI